ncbi:MAG: hypothetical protein V1873_07475 [Verrucomicrobiota bacterium]
MKIDFLIVRPGTDRPVGAIPDLARPMALGLNALGYSPAILTLEESTLPPPDVPIFRLRYREQVTAGLRSDPSAAHAHGVYNFRRFSFCEHEYVQEEVRPRPHHLLAAEVPAAFGEVTRFFDEHDIGCVVHPVMGAEVIRETVTYVARARGIPVMYNSNTRYFSDRTLLVADTRRTPFVRPHLRFEELPKPRQKYLLDYLEEKRAARPVERFWLADRSFPALAAAFIRERKYLEARRLLNGVKRAWQHVELQISRFYWRTPRPGDSYVYYPLQYNNESTIIVGCPKCFRQEYVLEYVERVLPEGVKLFFKQHPHNPAEGASLRFLRDVLRLKNAQLVPLHQSSWDLSRNAQVVVTIDNTVGYEALLLHKPVVVLGYPAYRGWGVTYDVVDLNDLPRAMDQAFAGGLTEERLLDFLASFESIHVPGNWFDPPLDPDELASGVQLAFDRLAGRHV